MSWDTTNRDNKLQPGTSKFLFVFFLILHAISYLKHINWVKSAIGFKKIYKLTDSANLLSDSNTLDIPKSPSFNKSDLLMNTFKVFTSL